MLRPLVRRDSSRCATSACQSATSSALARRPWGPRRNDNLLGSEAVFEAFNAILPCRRSTWGRRGCLCVGTVCVTLRSDEVDIGAAPGIEVVFPTKKDP